MTSTGTAVATQTYAIIVKATPEAIWDAITNPDQTDRYGYQGRVEMELRPGGAYRAHPSDAMRELGAADVIAVGEVVEASAPTRLVHTWNPSFAPEIGDEPATRITWELAPADFGGTRLTLTHELHDAPFTATMVAGAPGTGGGWTFVLSDLKTLLETGSAMAG
ncbi:MAG TPA: SRPBCC domain-containing protein [Gaiellales bacterium]